MTGHTRLRQLVLHFIEPVVWKIVKCDGDFLKHLLFCVLDVECSDVKSLFKLDCFVFELDVVCFTLCASEVDRYELEYVPLNHACTA